MTRADDTLRPPDAAGLWNEAGGVFELPRLVWRLPSLLQLPRGDGRRVLVLPGFGAGDASTGVLRSYLRALGYRSRGWGLGINRGDVPALLPRVLERVQALARDQRAPVPLVGWSLGGVLAREAARECPQAVEQVITLGSPVVGGPKYTAVANAYRSRGIDLDAIEAEVAARNERPIATPVTALYSRRDGIVAWRACIDRHNAAVEHVEVAATHLGLGFSSEVYSIVADRLARARAPERGDRVPA